MLGISFLFFQCSFIAFSSFPSLFICFFFQFFFLLSLWFPICTFYAYFLIIISIFSHFQYFFLKLSFFLSLLSVLHFFLFLLLLLLLISYHSTGKYLSILLSHNRFLLSRCYLSIMLYFMPLCIFVFTFLLLFFPIELFDILPTS